MADGTSKPIEQIRPGDMVLAVDHNDPEHDTPKPTKVTRFFDNGLKNVVKLIFENQETGEKIEVTCTPSHRFYVKNKGWVNAGSLQRGEQCISTNETEIIFFSREELQERQNVYNFEVEEEHTYFVCYSITFSILVHNECWLWEVGKGFGSGLLQGAVNIVNGVINTGKELGCQLIDVAGGVITAGSMLVSDNPIVFEPWSNSLKALDQHNVSTGGYYGNFAANVITVGVYSEVLTGIQWWNGEISDNEASEIIGSTGVMQYLTARAIARSSNSSASSHRSSISDTSIMAKEPDIASMPSPSLPDSPTPPSPHTINTPSVPGKISNNPKNRLIETGKPLKNGRGWVKRYVRMTEEDYARYNHDVFEFYESLDSIAQERGIPQSEIHNFRFQEMSKMRTEWLKNFYNTRKY